MSLNSDDYARLTGFEGEWRDTWWSRDFLELQSQRHSLFDCHQVLDIGCGAGHWGRILRPFLADHALLTGIDAVEDFLISAREKAGPTDSYVNGSAERLPLESESFDLVTGQTVFIHIDDVPQALQEAKRVLKPGGLFLAAEPNNVASSLTLLGGTPELPWEQRERWVRFQYLCEQGKRAEGDGDSSIGERLPLLLKEAGFQQISVCVNEKTPALVPPYETRAQQIERNQMLEWLEGDEWLGFGTREHSLRYFKASGQPKSDFEMYWKNAMLVQKQLRRALEDQTFSGSRCPNFYLIAARRA